MGWNPLQSLKGLESRLIDRAIADEIAHRESGIKRTSEYVGGLYKNDRDRLVQVIADRARDGAGRQIDPAVIRKELGEMEENDFLDRYTSQMRRGQGGFGSLGLRERMSNQFANNAIIRRGVYPTLTVGGAVAGGVAMTEGAQQLLALMSELQSQKEQAERLQESPLA